jgi:hypothetical protein
MGAPRRVRPELVAPPGNRSQGSSSATLVARVRALSGVGQGSIDRMEAWVRRQVGPSFG